MTTNTPTPALSSNVEELRAPCLHEWLYGIDKASYNNGVNWDVEVSPATYRKCFICGAEEERHWSRASTPTEKEALEKLVDDYGGADTSEGLFLSSLVASLRGLPGPTPAEVVNDLFGEVAILRNALREIVSWSDSGSPPKSLTDACQVGEDAFHRIACGAISRARSASVTDAEVGWSKTAITKAMDHLYSDAIDRAVTSYCVVGKISEAQGEDRVREQLKAAIKGFLEEIPKSDLVRLARPPAPNGNGTTVGAQPVAQLHSTPPAHGEGELRLDFHESDTETDPISKQSADMPATISDENGDIICEVNTEGSAEGIQRREAEMRRLVRALSRAPSPPQEDDLRETLEAICSELGCTIGPGVALRFVKELRRDLGRAHERHVELIRSWDDASPTERQELDRLRRGWGPSTPTERMARRTDLQSAMRTIEKAMDAVLPDDKNDDDLTLDHFQTAYDGLSEAHRNIIALLQSLPELADPDVAPPQQDGSGLVEEIREHLGHQWSKGDFVQSEKVRDIMRRAADALASTPKAGGRE